MSTNLPSISSRLADFQLVLFVSSMGFMEGRSTEEIGQKFSDVSGLTLSYKVDT